MRIISFVTQKGGSGKSTLASSIAAAAFETGERVFIIDMDPQQSLVQWSKTRNDKDIPVEAAGSDKLKKVLATLEKDGITLVLIDTPGAQSQATEAAMQNSDLCVIPARPNAFDLWSSETTRTVLKKIGTPYVFLLNQCPPAQQTGRIEEGAKALEAMGGLITPLISQRVDFQEATRHGLGVSEFAPSSPAADEIRKLWQSLKRRMAKTKTEKTSRKAA